MEIRKRWKATKAGERIAWTRGEDRREGAAMERFVAQPVPFGQVYVPMVVGASEIGGTQLPHIGYAPSSGLPFPAQ